MSAILENLPADVRHSIKKYGLNYGPLLDAIAQGVDIITGIDEWGDHCWEFTIDGIRYADTDFKTRESALKDAQSVARAVFRGECPYTGKPLK